MSAKRYRLKLYPGGRERCRQSQHPHCQHFSSGRWNGSLELLGRLEQPHRSRILPQAEPNLFVLLPCGRVWGKPNSIRTRAEVFAPKAHSWSACRACWMLALCCLVSLLPPSNTERSQCTIFGPRCLSQYEVQRQRETWHATGCGIALEAGRLVWKLPVNG